MTQDASRTPRMVTINGMKLPLDLSHCPADATEGWEMLCRAEAALAERDELLRDLLDKAELSASFQARISLVLGEKK